MIERHLRLTGRQAGTTEHVRDTAQKLAASWIAIRRHDENRAVTARAEPATKLH